MVWSPRMPSEITDQEENDFTSERQVGFWKAEPAPDQSGTEGIPLLSGKRSTGLPMAAWRAGHQDFGLRPDLCIQPESLCLDGDKIGLNGIHYENGLFSSSLSESSDKKLKILSKNVPLGQSVNTINSNFGEVGPFESLEEIEAQTIGNLLPDDDDLLSGVLGDLGYVAPTNAHDDLDDDIFGCGGGMELEADDIFSCKKTSDSVGRTVSNDQQGSLNSLYASEHPHGEHPSRTLFVRNINSNVEDAELKTLFEQYGDIRTLYTACKHRGFVMISYYDIRSARNAMRALQNKPLRRRKLDIHFSIPKVLTLPRRKSEEFSVAWALLYRSPDWEKSHYRPAPVLASGDHVLEVKTLSPKC